MPSMIKRMYDTLRTMVKSIPVCNTMAREKKVNNANVAIKPSMIPNGFDSLPSNEPERIIGKTGKIHGEIMRPNPSRKASPTET